MTDTPDTPTAGETASPCVARYEALLSITLIPAMPFPDPGAHSWRAFGEAVYRAYCDIQRTAKQALSSPPTACSAYQSLVAQRDALVRELEEIANASPLEFGSGAKAADEFQSIARAAIKAARAKEQTP